MHYMLFEVWNDVDGGGQVPGVVHSQNDKLRRASPPAILVHSFRAYSDRDFWRQYYEWDDRGEWKPLRICRSISSREEVDERERYLKVREVG